MILIKPSVTLSEEVQKTDRTKQTQIAVPVKEKPYRFPYVIPAIVLLFAVLLAGWVWFRFRLTPPRLPAIDAGGAFGETSDEAEWQDWVTPAFLPRGGESRSGILLEEVRDIVVHYVANPGTSALANRNYFAMETTETSAHFIVGLDGEILQCLPLTEKSSATGARNRDTVSIEVCHPDETGEFSEATRASLVRLLGSLCEKFDLTEDHIIRHYDVTGKLCPLYYVQNPAAWDALRSDAAAFRKSLDESKEHRP